MDKNTIFIVGVVILLPVVIYLMWRLRFKGLVVSGLVAAIFLAPFLDLPYMRRGSLIDKVIFGTYLGYFYCLLLYVVVCPIRCWWHED